MWANLLAPKPNVVPPPNSAVLPITLGKERSGDKNPPPKLCNHRQNALNNLATLPGYGSITLQYQRNPLATFNI